MEHLQVPTNSKGSTVSETLLEVQESGKWSQTDANYVPQAETNVCGTCRFYLRSESGAVGTCQVVEGDINWNGTSDLYISAEEEAAASLAELNAYADDDDKKKRGIMNKLQQAYEFIKGLIEVERRIKDVDEWDGSASRWSSTEAYCNDSLINLNEGDPEDWTQANCKLPIREPGDSKDTFVRQAVFAAAGGNGIQAVDAPEDAKKAAANVLIGAYEEMDLVAPDAVFTIADKEPPTERSISFGAIHEQVWNLLIGDDWDRWLIDVYDDNGQMYALITSNGHLFRQQLGIVNDQVELAGEPFQVSVDHPVIQTRTTIQRQTDGKYRWLSISATSVLNRVGQIDSKALFDSFIAHTEETKEYPIRQFYHQGSTFRTGQCDFLGRDDNCLITSGLFDDTELAQIEVKARKNEPDYWGESIGYLPTEKPDLLEVQSGINIPVYTTGILREISTLPEKQAANLFTITTQQEEVTRMLKGKVGEAFVQLFIDGGQTEDDAEKWLSENPAELNRMIKENGLVKRNKKNDKPAETGSEVVEVVEVDDALIAEVVKRVARNDTELQKQIEGLVTTVESINVNVKTLNDNQGDIVTRIDTLQQDADKRFEQLERTKTEDLQESITNMPSVPQVRRFEYTPRQGAQSNGQPAGTMAEKANGLKSHY